MAPNIASTTIPARGFEHAFSLPPLILHPFADASGPERLVESSRASLVLQGLLPGGESSTEDLERKLLDGRYCEIRMLFYVGRDVMRWVEQCMEFVERHREELPAGVQKQSFMTLLIQDAPYAVQDKLRKWGVADFKAIFSRAIGLNSMFAKVPAKDCLTDDFLRNYYRYADQLFTFVQGQCPYTPISSGRFDFELYSSGEYTRMLERQWEQ
ncbi:MAG TPA: hypothetical protein VKU01_26955 [Bryobacteraceae bacterium]|nr:hypothetical protein [Bryobacteraceae bacterium]